MSRILPPRKREWKEGTVQIGLFIRTQDGSVIECTANEANAATNVAAAELFAKMIEGQKS